MSLGTWQLLFSLLAPVSPLAWKATAHMSFFYRFCSHKLLLCHLIEDLMGTEDDNSLRVNIRHNCPTKALVTFHCGIFLMMLQLCAIFFIFISPQLYLHIIDISHCDKSHCWFDTVPYCKMITNVELANAPITSHNYNFFFVGRTFNI